MVLRPWMTGTRRKSSGGGVAVDFAEGVLEDALDGVGGGGVGEERKAFWMGEGERAEVVHAEDVVGVVVRVEDGVEVGEVLADGLSVEVGAGVDEDVAGVAGRIFETDQYGRAGAAVGRVGKVGVGADGAGAAQRGNAHAGAAAEKGEGSHKAEIRE
jgi:hypothetical protein